LTIRRSQRRKLDPLRQELSFLPQVAHRVLCKRLERFSDPAALFGELPFELPLLEYLSRRKTCSVAVETGSAHGQQLTLVHVFEETFSRHIDQADSSAHECKRSWIWKAAGLRRSDVDHDAHTGLEERFRRDAIEIRVVDDRNVVGREPLDEILRAAIELRMAGELDETHEPFTLERNSRPPSMRWSSSRRSASLRRLMRV
jgi:hypothetical protein